MELKLNPGSLGKLPGCMICNLSVLSPVTDSGVCLKYLLCVKLMTSLRHLGNITRISISAAVLQ